MKRFYRRVITTSIFLILLIGVSCSSTRNVSVDGQRRGLLMMEGEHIYKNKGFYNSKKSHKRRKNNRRAAKKYYRR